MYNEECWLADVDKLEVSIGKTNKIQSSLRKESTVTTFPLRLVISTKIRL